MGKKNHLPAQKCVRPTATDPNQITVADTVSAFEAVIKSEPPPYKNWHRNTMSYLRRSSLVICQYVGEQKDSHETKTPENTLVSEIIGIEDGLKKFLKGKVSKGVRTQHLCQLHLIIECGRPMGLSHALFDAQHEWDQLKFVRMDMKAKRLKLALRRSGIRPRDLSKKHLDSWSAACDERGLTREAIRASISQFKLAIRASKLQSSFPNLDVESLAHEHYCVVREEMHPYSRRQLEEMLDLLDRLDANGIISKGKGSREAFDLQVRQLYGYARDHAQVLEGIGGKITDLNQILNQEVISKCVRWG